jgi:hypothetical protein
VLFEVNVRLIEFNLGMLEFAVTGHQEAAENQVHAHVGHTQDVEAHEELGILKDALLYAEVPRIPR